MKLFKKVVLFFGIGSIGYALIELLWRRRTHWTMMIAGGICFLLFYVIIRFLKNRSIFLKAALAALSVTVIEFIFGVIFNLGFEMNVWDYSNQPFNLLGQVCPTFTFLWFLLAIVMLPTADKIDRLFERILSENIEKRAEAD